MLGGGWWMPSIEKKLDSEIEEEFLPRIWGLGSNR